MQKDPNAIRAQIDVALAQIGTQIPADLLDVFPTIEDWVAVSDYDIPLIHDVMIHPLGVPQPILTAAVIAVESEHALLLRCLAAAIALVSQPDLTTIFLQWVTVANEDVCPGQCWPGWPTPWRSG